MSSKFDVVCIELLLPFSKVASIIEICEEEDMVRAKKRGRWHAVGWLTKGTLAAAFCLCFPGRTTSVAQETSWQHQLDDGQKLREQGRYTEAEEVYSAVLVEAEKFGPEDRRVALTLNELAGLYHARGRLSRSRTALPASIGHLGKTSRANGARQYLEQSGSTLP